MERIWDLLRSLPRDIEDDVCLPSGACYDDFPVPPAKRIRLAASSSRAPPPEDIAPPQLEKRKNDCVYEYYKPPEGRRPSVELIFFHGLQLKKISKAHVTSWLSRDGSESWLDWIAKAIPDCRIITISYDAHSEKTDKHGRIDKYATAENLLQDLTENNAKVGQDGCPVVMVGHCLGGLVMKELCFKTHFDQSLHSSDKLENLLHNIKGFFFYASPHHGTKLADMSKNRSRSALFEDMTTLNRKTERENEHFRKLRQKYKSWKTFGIVEAHEVILGSFKGLVVTEASARSDVDGFYTDSSDHFNVSRPESPTSSSFTLFMSFIFGILNEDKTRLGPKIRLPLKVVGLQREVFKVQKLLEGSRRLAMFGMGGIGKTTLVETLHNTISGSFEYTCYLRDVKTKLGTMVDTDTLHEEIVKTLKHKGRKVIGDFNWSTLRRKKVLIILDDVASEAQVMIMTKDDEFLDESRVIVTSRDKEFLREYKIFNATLLGKEKSKQLFCINAFKELNPTAGYEDLVERFLEKCQGLPLALKVAGSYVYKRPKGMWDSALERLRNAKALNGIEKDGLWSILRVSYDALQDEEKEMFLDIATLYFGRRLDEVKMLWKVCSLTQDAGWENLVEKGLVTAEAEHGQLVIRMHEILRDLGRKEACPNPQNVTGHTRVLHEIQSRTTSWPFYQGAGQDKPKVKVLQIIGGAATSSSISIGAIHEFDDLRVFWLEGGSLSGACHLFPRNLLCVKLTGLHRWTDSDIEESFPKELEEQQTVRYLAIEYSPWLKTLPISLGQLRGLQCLTISRCSKLKTFPNSLGHLQGLQYLSIERCDELGALPDTLGELRALKSLTIEFCENVSLPNTLGHLQALKQLTITFCKYISIPESLGQLKALEELTIDWCENVSLPNSLGELRALKHLVTSHCLSLGVLEDTLGQLEALEHLRIEIQGRLDLRPNTLGQLRALKHLKVTSEYFGDSLPDGLVKIRGLEYLCVSGRLFPSETFPQDVLLRVLPNDFGELKALERLELNSCGGLQALPGSLGQLQALKVLEIKNCHSFEYLPHTLGQLKSLERLHIETVFGPGLKAIPDSIGELQSLKYLYLHTEGLEALPSTLGKLQALKHLELFNCTGLKSLPDTIGRLQALKHLKLYRLGLEALPGTLGERQALEELCLSGFDSLEALPDTVGLLHALTDLVLNRCDKIKVLPDTLGHLKSLQHLSIRSCHRLRGLPDTLGQLQSLEALVVKQCASLTYLPGSVKQIIGGLKNVSVEVLGMQVSRGFCREMPL